MSFTQKNKPHMDSTLSLAKMSYAGAHSQSIPDWQPTATLSAIKARAVLLAQIRRFFAVRSVLEVETPLLCRAAATDPFLNPIAAHSNYFLQTSPEYAMKRLLSAGVGSIYQICKAFRGDEQGRHHNSEFTMLEWYRVGWTHHDLMDEVDALLMEVLNTDQADRISYEKLFQKHFNINPHTISLEELRTIAEKHIQFHASSTSGNHEILENLDKSDKSNNIDNLDKDDWLNLLITHCIEPSLGFERPVMIYDYPSSQAALAKIRKVNTEKAIANNNSFIANPAYSVAERFEVYFKGIELANGYHELTDSIQQKNRFQKDCDLRSKLNRPTIPIDDRLIAALESGFPDCAGIALGVDRLLMLKLGVHSIDECLTFNFKNA